MQHNKWVFGHSLEDVPEEHIYEISKLNHLALHAFSNVIEFGGRATISAEDVHDDMRLNLLGILRQIHFHFFTFGLQLCELIQRCLLDHINHPLYFVLEEC